MKNSKQSHEIIRQNDTSVKPSLKHDANLQKNVTIHFQIGIILCLLAVFALFEMQFETHIPKYNDNYTETEIDETEFVMGAIQPYKPKKAIAKKPSKAKNTTFINAVKVVDDNNDLDQLKAIVDDFLTDNEVKDPVIDESIFDFDIPDAVDDTTVDFAFIEHVPLYPGCEKQKGNAARKKCMSEKIAKLVQRKFNGTAIASDYGLSGKQKIYVQFKIDETGKVADVKTRAAHAKLEEEAQRVVNTLPDMQPGLQRDKPVSVRYTLPIYFQVQ